MTTEAVRTIGDEAVGISAFPSLGTEDVFVDFLRFEESGGPAEGMESALWHILRNKLVAVPEVGRALETAKVEAEAWMTWWQERRLPQFRGRAPQDKLPDRLENWFLGLLSHLTDKFWSRVFQELCPGRHLASCVARQVEVRECELATEYEALLRAEAAEQAAEPVGV